MSVKDIDDLGNLALLLADCHIDAEEILPLLVNDRVERDRRLPGLAVANDQLTLTAADRDHRVNRLDASLHGCVDRFAINHAGCDALQGPRLRGGDRALAVDRLTKRVHHSTDQGVADRDLHNAPGASYLVALGDLEVVAEHDGADRVLFEVQGDAHDPVREFQQLACHYGGESPDASDAVTNLGHCADGRGLD